MKYVVGIDVGTTAIKVAVINDQMNVVFTCASDHNADVVCKNARSEQSMAQILRVVEQLILEVPDEVRQCTRSIAITGQMHGMCIAAIDKTNKLIKCTRNVTWMDRRWDPESMLAMQNTAARHGLSRLDHGYGSTTLAYWVQNPPMLYGLAAKSRDNQVLDLGYADLRYRACSALDVLAQYWTRSANIMGESLAHSLGNYGGLDKPWPEQAWRELNVPEKYHTLLPRVVKDGTTQHPMQAEHCKRLGLAQDVQIVVPFGDNQAQTFGLMRSLPSAVKGSSESQKNGPISRQRSDNVHITQPLLLNLGTSCQLTMVMTTEQAEAIDTSDAMLEVRPFVDEQQLVTLASLNGGKVLHAFAHSVVSSLASLHLNVGQVLQEWDETPYDPSTFAMLEVEPLMFGERGREDAVFRLARWQGHSLATVAHATITALFQHLHDVAHKAGLTRLASAVLASGKATDLKFVRAALEHVFKLPLLESGDLDHAASGSAAGACLLINDVAQDLSTI
eukprot:TRINITY_DN10455_c0_g1_i1.p1 TRINITY_DN10455_c0_g1~~TRINITY_DN10455_c0_g1_i1.p1  ORF type:complete len:505 (+),score=83.77 TRINITY_DN10455_c0_g1_i1:145-1659(+)